MPNSPRPPGVNLLRHLIVLILAIFLDAFQNTKTITVKLRNSSVTAPFALMTIGGYPLGTVIGRNVLAFVLNSIARVGMQQVVEL